MEGVFMSVNLGKLSISNIVLVAAVVFSLVLCACNQPGDEGDSSVSAGGAKKPNVDKKLAIAAVNGVAIPRARFDARVEGEFAMYKSGGMELTDEVKRQAKRQTFARIASDEVACQKAEELGVAVSVEAAKADVDKVVERMGGQEAVMAFLGSMGGTIKTMDDFVDWKRVELTRDALIQKVGEKATVDKEALKKQFDELMAEYEKNRNEGKPAVMPGGSFDEFVERQLLQAKLVEFDKYMDGALTTAKVEVYDPDLEGAIEEFVKNGDTMGAGMGGSPHGGMGGGTANPHGGMPGMGGGSPHGGGGGSDSGEGDGKDPLSSH